jgi:hypothetical protein
VCLKKYNYLVNGASFGKMISEVLGRASAQPEVFCQRRANQRQGQTLVIVIKNVTWLLCI